MIDNMKDKTKNPKKVLMGKKSRAQGNLFETKVRKDLEEKGWICDKWTNQVEFFKGPLGMEIRTDDNLKENEFELSYQKKGFKAGQLVKAKPKFVYNPQLKRRVMISNGSGFPDFIAFKLSKVYNTDLPIYEVIGVESKMAGKLDNEEKEKCRWLLDNRIFSKILVVSKTKVKNRIVVVYEEFK